MRVDDTLHSRFLDVASKFSDRIAVGCRDRVLTYRELADRSSDLADSLRRAATDRDQVVAVCLERGTRIALQ